MRLWHATWCKGYNNQVKNQFITLQVWSRSGMCSKEKYFIDTYSIYRYSLPSLSISGLCSVDCIPSGLFSCFVFLIWRYFLNIIITFMITNGYVGFWCILTIQMIHVNIYLLREYIITYFSLGNVIIKKDVFFFILR